MVNNQRDLCFKTVFISPQERNHSMTQLQSNLKDYEQEITKLKSQLFQEQQKLFDCESEWKENMAKHDTHAKSLRMEVRLFAYYKIGKRT